MTSSSPLFDHWSRIDHSAPIGIVTILTVILGFMVYAAGMTIKFTSPDMKSKPWWNNIFSTLTAFSSLGQSIVVLLACRHGLGKSKAALHAEEMPTMMPLYHASTLLYVVTLCFAKCFALFFFREHLSAPKHWTWKKKLFFWTSVGLSASWTSASIAVLSSRCASNQSRAAFGTGCIAEWIVIFIGDASTDFFVVCFAVIEIWPLQMKARVRVRAISTCAVRLCLPALAALRLYLYCSQGTDDPTMTLWSIIVVTQLQIFAAQACTIGFLITKRMSGMVSRFGLGIRTVTSGLTGIDRSPLYIDKRTYLPWPSTLPTQELPHGPTPFIDYPTRGPEAQSPKQSEVPDLPVQPKLLPRLSAGSNPIVVTSKDTGKVAAALLKRKGVKRTTQLYSRQAQILADLLGGAEAMWHLASIVLPSGSVESPNECAGSCEVIRIQAKVLYIDYVQSQEVYFKLTIDTIDALKKHHRALCHGSFEAHSRGNVKMEEDVKILMENFDRAIDHFVHHVGTVCLGRMRKDGSGELTTQHSTIVESTVLELFGPYQRYLDMLSSRLDGVFFETASVALHHPGPILQIDNSDTLVSTDATASQYLLQ
ncbi:hypothetical protein MBLNU13_g09840t1 [Cladosporium sp. NU13]